MLAVLIFPLLSLAMISLLAAMLMRDGAKMYDALQGHSPLAMGVEAPVTVRVRWVSVQEAPAPLFSEPLRAAA